MVRRTTLVPIFLTVFAPACLAPDDDFQGTEVLMTDRLTDALPRATTEVAGATTDLPDATTGVVPDPPECGDGRHDPGEACDHGDANADDGACTRECRLAACGDGLVHPGSEQCDLGPDGNADDGPCTTRCTIAVCGDGLVRAGVEECDLGLAANVDTGPCTTHCTVAACGDGLVHAGVEQCDLGVAGNAPGYGGCLPECVLGPRCGDMVLQPDHEECDDGADNGSGLSSPDGAPCDAGCQRIARLVFITADAFHGDLGGLDGADLKCRLAAKNAALPDWDRFRAWLSDDTGSPLTRFEHGPAHAGVPYVLPNGLRVADDFDHLIAAGPLRGIDITETGEQLPPQRPVWTNTSFTGAALDPDAHCDRWTSNAPALPATRIGMASAPPENVEAWKDQRYYTSWDHSACASSWRLYCFEQ